MAYLFSDGFDGQGALADRWTSIDAGITLLTDGGKYGVGTKALSFSSIVQTIIYPFTYFPTNSVGGILNPIHFSFFFKASSGPSNTAGIVGFANNNNEGFTLELQATTGKISLTDFVQSFNMTGDKSGTSGISSASVTDGVWHHIECKYIADNVSGIAKIWIDGILDIDFSGDTLINGTVVTPTVIYLGAGWTSTAKFDDFLVWDEEGTSMNTSGQLGIHRIETLIPNGAGNSTQLTVTGAASNYLAVDEADADDDTTYVQSSTATHKDLYAYSNMSGVPVTINGVAVHTRGTNPDNGAISFKTKTRSNVTEADGATYQLPASGVYAQHTEFVGLDPDGSVAWTKAKVDAAQFGVEVV